MLYASSSTVSFVLTILSGLLPHFMDEWACGTEMCYSTPEPALKQDVSLPAFAPHPRATLVFPSPAP